MPRWLMVLAGVCAVLFGVVFVVYAYTDSYLLPFSSEHGVADEIPTNQTAHLIDPSGHCDDVYNDAWPTRSLFCPVQQFDGMECV